MSGYNETGRELRGLLFYCSSGLGKGNSSGDLI